MLYTVELLCSSAKEHSGLYVVTASKISTQLLLYDANVRYDYSNSETIHRPVTALSVNRELMSCSFLAR